MKSEYEATVKEREELQNQLDHLRKDQDADKQLMDSLKVSSGEHSLMKHKNLRKYQDADKQLMDSLKVSSGEHSLMKHKK
jgi:hypothetical protein